MESDYFRAAKSLPALVGMREAGTHSAAATTAGLCGNLARSISSRRPMKHKGNFLFSTPAADERLVARGKGQMHPSHHGNEKFSTVWASDAPHAGRPRRGMRIARLA